MAASVRAPLIVRRVRPPLRVFCRYRYKQKWATTVAGPSGPQLALQYFDMTYSAQLGAVWPSVRVGLLSEQKYGALINGFSSAEGVAGGLRALNATDFLQEARTTTETSPASTETSPASRETSPASTETSPASTETSPASTETSPASTETSPASRETSPASTETSPTSTETSPASTETSPASTETSPASTGTSPATTETAPASSLACYTFPRTDISRFPPARCAASGLLGYYLLDAACLLPILALQVHPEHRVLDLCAAPGGKTLALLLEGCGYLAANDASISRTNRLRRVLQSYVPRELRTEERVRVTSWDGTEWLEDALYDRVLVDAPCTADRHSLLEEENNVFHRMRRKERLRLPLLQTQLLLSGLRAVAPGGDVVYATCTLSALQNECVVEGALLRAAEEYGVRAEVQDLRCFQETFKKTFHFQQDCRLGALVLPHLTANYGPLYFCKLRRLH